MAIHIEINDDTNEVKVELTKFEAELLSMHLGAYSLKMREMGYEAIADWVEEVALALVGQGGYDPDAEDDDDDDEEDDEEDDGSAEDLAAAINRVKRAQAREASIAEIVNASRRGADSRPEKRDHDSSLA